MKPRHDLAMLEGLDAWIKAEAARLVAVRALAAATSPVARERAEGVAKRKTAAMWAARVAMGELVEAEASERC